MRTKALIIILALWGLTACNETGSGAGVVEFPGSTPPPAVAVTVAVKSGAGFECFALGGSIYCRGNSANSDIAIASGATFEEYVRDSDSVILSLETWDDTICFTTMVLDRPYSGGVGVATYCIGEATLGGAIGAYPAVYSGPNFIQGTNGSPDVSYESTPMMGGDFGMTDVINATYLMDGDGAVTVVSENCERDGVNLTCETFAATVQDE